MSWSPKTQWADSIRALDLPANGLIAHRRPGMVRPLILIPVGVVMAMALVVIAGIAVALTDSWIWGPVGVVAACAVGLWPLLGVYGALVERRGWDVTWGSRVSSDTTVFHGEVLQGTSESAVQAFGAGRAAAGAEGERRTAAILDLLDGPIAGLHVFHGLDFPGSSSADIDHALAYGDSMLLVDSKMYRAGTYSVRHARTTDRRGQERIDSDRVEIVRAEDGHVVMNSMPAAARKMRHYPVRIAVVIHGSGVRIDPASSQVGDGWSLQLLTPDQLLDGPVRSMLTRATDQPGSTDAKLVAELESLHRG